MENTVTVVAVPVSIILYSYFSAQHNKTLGASGVFFLSGGWGLIMLWKVAPNIRNEKRLCKRGGEGGGVEGTSGGVYTA